MKPHWLTASVGWASIASAVQPVRSPAPALGRFRHKRVEDTTSQVPEYNFTMPVDHFDPSNKNSFDNKYFVNDTYYRPGGPVILFDYGESGISPEAVASDLAEANGETLVMRMASKLSGLVIAWEHRYYGSSRPVLINDESGLPEQGVSGYKYLTVEQALRDVAYFANNFNKTELRSNSRVQNVSGLGPYHAPWIFVGGSYPGSRAAWMRVKYPEIIYASYASSAPVQIQEDGSLYFNPALRSMPQNCTNDIKAAVKYFDETMASGPADEVDTVKGKIFVATSVQSARQSLDTVYSSNFEAARDLLDALLLGDGFQTRGPQQTTQQICDRMEAFDVKTLQRADNRNNSAEDYFKAVFFNQGGQDPPDDGIAASHGSDGGRYAFSAWMYGVFEAKKALGDNSTSSNDSMVDEKSWAWQVVSEFGIFQGSSPDVAVVSQLCNVTAIKDIDYRQQTFTNWPTSDIPEHINNANLLGLGGWNMKASNVLFTNGEFDPWRAFSVASEETESSRRKVVQTVPKCNQVPQDNDVFGLVYAGAVHGEDFNADPSVRKASQTEISPMQQGLELFLDAWKEWAPCFNQSRDMIRNGQGVDGNGHNADGSPTGQDQSGASALMGRATWTYIAMVSTAAVYLLL